MTAASVSIKQHGDFMKGRAATTVIVSYDLHEELLTTFRRLSAVLKQTVRARDVDTQQSLTKAADDHEAMATLMDAGAAMSENTCANVYLVLTSLASLGKLAQSMADDGALICVPVSTLTS